MLNWTTRKVLMPGISFWLSCAFDHPLFRFGYLFEKFPQDRAQVFGIPKVRPHPRPQLGFINELVGMSAVLEWSLRAKQQGINVRGRTALHEFTRQFELLS